MKAQLRSGAAQSAQRSLFSVEPATASSLKSGGFLEDLRAFEWNGRKNEAVLTKTADALGSPIEVETVVNEFWTSKQRAGHSLHEVSYRACFKPQLPRFFIERLTEPEDVVYDPFSGRGTTALEAALLGRVPHACDVNPLSRMLLEPRLDPPTIDEIGERLSKINFADSRTELRDDLLVFYHPETLREICSLRAYLLSRQSSGEIDNVDRWIRMVAVNRLTGHSPGFFSVYTLPPNQAVTLEAQRAINEKRAQTPPRREIPKLILGKSRSLISDLVSEDEQRLRASNATALLLTGRCASTPAIATGAVRLVVTSPPFLDVVDYATDNWLRCWFAGIDVRDVTLTVPKRLDDWKQAMSEVFAELGRVLAPGGHVAFEVGEVRGGKIKLEETVVPCGMAAGLRPLVILINSQVFTKTANCWGVSNNDKGTNTNRIVVFQKDR